MSGRGGASLYWCLCRSRWLLLGSIIAHKLQQELFEALISCVGFRTRRATEPRQKATRTAPAHTNAALLLLVEVLVVCMCARNKSSVREQIKDEVASGQCRSQSLTSMRAISSRTSSWLSRSK